MESLKKKMNNGTMRLLVVVFNFRLSDINCALGNSQLKKIDFIIKKKENLSMSII